MEKTIYVQLLDEGVTVYRPVPATAVTANSYILGGQNFYDPENEVWEFHPGDHVAVEERALAGGLRLVAVAKLALP